METHSFHLPSREMSMLMQDVGYILGLRLDGLVVIGMVEPQNWKDMVEQFISHQPPNLEEGKKEKKTSGVSSAWLWQRSCLAMAHGGTIPVSRRFWEHRLVDGPT